MRKFLAILACKLLRFVGKLVGKGSSLPGKYALKICPDILRRVDLPKHIIAVTGSNGKTSTVEMIAAILYILNEAAVQEEKGAHILDVNVGLPDIDEVSMMTDVVREIQSITNLPLQIDTVNEKALEKAMRIYNGSLRRL